MNKSSVEELAANIAKDIVASAMKSSPTDYQISTAGGKLVVDFYNEIFKGISEILSNSSINQE